MWSFSTFKDIRYWILLIPTIIILIVFAFFTPDYILQKPFVTPLTLLAGTVLFWSTYHLWKYSGDKKKEYHPKDNINM